jgi:hypothetical protein
LIFKKILNNDQTIKSSNTLSRRMAFGGGVAAVCGGCAFAGAGIGRAGAGVFRAGGAAEAV